MVIANPDGVTRRQLEGVIRSRFSDLQVWPDILHFKPEELGWPTAYFAGRDLNGDDLTVYEVNGTSFTSEPAEYAEAAHDLTSVAATGEGRQ